MTDPLVVISPAELSVEPGGQARVEVTVRNVGDIVENYRIDVVSEVPGTGPATWAEVTPAELSVYPKEKGTAIVVLSPPAGAATSGRFPFGVRVMSTVPPYGSAVVEGDLDVGRVFGLQATIRPMSSSGRWRGHHLLTYTNWGNAPVRLRLAASDPDEKLGFLLHPTDLELPLGGSAAARLTVRTRKPFLRGTPVRLPFEVVGEQDGAAPGPAPVVGTPNDPKRPVVNGVLVQKPIIGRATVALAALVGLVGAGAVVLALHAPKDKPTPGRVTLPDPPTAVQAKPVDSSSIEVRWHGVAGVTDYRVIATQNGAVQQTTAVSGAEIFTAKGLDPGTGYCFAVRAMRDKDHVSSATRIVPAACAKTLALSTTASGSAPPPTSSGASTSSSGSSPSSTPVSPSGSVTTGGSGSPTSTGNSDPLNGPPPPTAQLGYIVMIGEVRGTTQNQVKERLATLFAEVQGAGYPTDGALFSGRYDITVGGFPLAEPSPFYALWAGPFNRADGGNQATQCNTALAALPGPPTCRLAIATPK